MKRIIVLITMFTLFVCSVFAQQETTSTIDLIMDNWQEIIAAIIGVIAIVVRITPSKKDNDIFNFIKAILDKLIPNLKKGGGVHK